MSFQDLPPDIDRLLNQLIDDQLSQSEFDELEQYFKDNPQARQAYFDYVDINSGIQKDDVQRLKALDQFVTSSLPHDKITSTRPIVSEKRSLHSLRYFSVAIASILLILLVEWFTTGHVFWDNNTETPAIASPEVELPYVATLTRANACQWGDKNPPQFSGQRLLSKDLFLQMGVAEFRFDSGIRLILEGPTKITIDSANRATVNYGKVVLHGYESAPEFELITPQATFFDIGTEYGTKVEEDGTTELHVFDGIVRVEPSDETSDDQTELRVKQGEARQIKNKTNDEITLQPENFKREVPEISKNLNDVQNEIIAYDSFHPGKIAFPKWTSEWRKGGLGWKDQNFWRKRRHKIDPASGTSHPEKALHPKLLSASQIGCVEFARGDIAWRTLQNPVRLDIDAIYYISFFIENSKEPKSSNQQYGNVSLRTLEKATDGSKSVRKILFGMSSENFPILQNYVEAVETAPPLMSNKPYFFVGKIVASQKSPDQIFLRAFAENEKIPDQEPLVWTCTSDPFRDSTVYDHARIHAGRSGKFFFDELRIGKTWKSVVDFRDPNQRPAEKQ